METHETGAAECHLIECQGCFGGILIREPLRKGDSVICPKCKDRNIVEGIYSDCRDDESETEIEGICVPFLD